MGNNKMFKATLLLAVSAVQLEGKADQYYKGNEGDQWANADGTLKSAPEVPAAEPKDDKKDAAKAEKEANEEKPKEEKKGEEKKEEAKEGDKKEEAKPAAEEKKEERRRKLPLPR